MLRLYCKRCVLRQFSSRIATPKKSVSINSPLKKHEGDSAPSFFFAVVCLSIAGGIVVSKYENDKVFRSHVDKSLAIVGISMEPVSWTPVSNKPALFLLPAAPVTAPVTVATATIESRGGASSSPQSVGSGDVVRGVTGK